MLDFLTLFINLSNKDKMEMRLIAPTALSLIMAFSIIFVGDWCIERLQHFALFVRLAAMLAEFQYWAVLFFLGLSFLFLILSGLKYWQWFNGNGTHCCPICGGIVSEKHGRWGYYYRCLACNNTHSIR